MQSNSTHHEEQEEDLEQPQVVVVQQNERMGCFGAQALPAVEAAAHLVGEERDIRQIPHQYAG